MQTHVMTSSWNHRQLIYYPESSISNDSFFFCLYPGNNWTFRWNVMFITHSLHPKHKLYLHLNVAILWMSELISFRFDVKYKSQTYLFTSHINYVYFCRAHVFKMCIWNSHHIFLNFCTTQSVHPFENYRKKSATTWHIYQQNKLLRVDVAVNDVFVSPIWFTCTKSIHILSNITIANVFIFFVRICVCVCI